ncbi:MAG: NAD-dependent epimerase/dehydratase family protein [Desulfomonilaceae bacterium]
MGRTQINTVITGGTGFVGAELAKTLIKRDENPIIFDVMEGRGALTRLSDRFEYIRGSVANLSELANAFSKRNVDRIFHLGGMLSLPSEQNPWQAFDVNAVGTYNILEAARIFGVKQVVFSSSIAVFSEDLPDDEVTETTCCHPLTIYGTCKVFGELLGKYYARRFGLDFRAVRLPSVVGPFSTVSHMSSYNCWAIEEPLKGRPYAIPVEPESKVPAIYFKDGARALLLLAEAEKSRLSATAYNIAGIKPTYSAGQLVQAVQRELPQADLFFAPDAHIMSLVTELAQMRINDDRACRDWGWAITYGLDEMVKDFINEFQQRN